MKEENNTKAAKIKRGDTLDYYNDSLPKKAVESLFSDDDKPTNNYIKGFDDDDQAYNSNEYSSKERDVVIQEKLAFKDTSRHNTNSYADENLEENIAMYSERNTRPRRELFPGEDKIRRNTGGVKPEPRRNAPREEEYPMQDDRPRQTTRPRVTYNEDDTPRRRAGYDDDYDIDDDLADTGEHEIPRRRDTEPRMRRSAPIDDIPRRSPEQQEDRIPRRNTGTQEDRIPRRNMPPSDERIPRPRPDQNRPTGRGSQADSRRRYPNQQTKAAASKIFDEEMDTESPVTVRIIILGAAAILMLALFVWFIVRINSLQSQLADAMVDQEALAAAVADYEAAKLDLSKRDETIAALNETISEYSATITALQANNDPLDDDPPPPPPGTDQQAPPPNQQPANPPPATPTRTHTVEERQYLGTIANIYYGSSSDANVQKIKDANNLTNDIIRVGQVLIIPE